MRRPPSGLTVPEGYRLWEPSDGAGAIPKPRLHPDAYHGPIGDFMRAVEGETEADPIAVGIWPFVTAAGRNERTVYRQRSESALTTRRWRPRSGSLTRRTPSWAR